MALSVEAAIMEALFRRVALLTTHTPAQIAWPNQTFTPPDDQNFLRVAFFPNTTDRVLIDTDGPHQRLGLLQLSVHWKKNDGETRPRDIAGQVAAFFPADLRLGTDPQVRITAAPNVADLIVEAARIQIPVMIPWEAWA